MASKIPALITFVALVTVGAQAQQNPQPNSQAMGNIDTFEKVEKYRKMRGAGATLTVVGSVLAIVGMVNLVNSMDVWEGSSESEVTTGTVCTLAGYGMLGAGIPLWIVGGVQHKKYSTQAQQLSIKVSATPQAQGLTLSFRF